MRRLSGAACLVLCVGLLGCTRPNALQTEPPPDFGGTGDLATSRSDLGSEPGHDLAMDLAPPMEDLRGAGDLAGVCNTLVNGAPIVHPTVVNQPMPSPKGGGTIQPGLYYLTQMTIYQGGTTNLTEVQATQDISGTTIQAVQSTGNGSLHDTRQFTAVGTMLTEVLICGTNGTLTLGYDANATQITTYNNNSKMVDVWTKQ